MKKQILNPYLPLKDCIPDGEPHVFGDRLYIYGSHDQEGGNAFCLLDYEVFSAPIDDLSDFRSEGIAYRKEQDPDYSPEEYNVMYAPDVVQGNDGRYYLYYAMSGGHFTGPLHAAVSDSPAGPFSYYGEVRNPDGTPFTQNITFDPGVINDDGVIRLYYGWAMAMPPEVLKAAGIDASVPYSKNETFVGMQSDFFEKSPEEILQTPGGIQGANVLVLEDDMLTVKEGPKRIVPGRCDAVGTDWEGHAFFEASSIRKIGDTYYFIYSSEQMHELCYAVSKEPDRDFVFGGTLISHGDVGIDGRERKDALAVLDNNHGSLVCIKDQWYIFYHRHTHRTPFSRHGCAEKIELREDGHFVQARITSMGLNDGLLSANETYPAPTACVLTNGNMSEWHDNDFTKEKGKQIPYSVTRGEERFITGIGDGCVIGWRSFDLKKETGIRIRVRGELDGTFMLTSILPEKIGKGAVESVQACGQIRISPTVDWTDLYGVMPADRDSREGTEIYLVYCGSGMGDLMEMELTEKG